jgi:nucleoid-associated protein YgaU
MSGESAAVAASSAWSRPPVPGDPGAGASTAAAGSGQGVHEVEPDASPEPWDLPPRRPVPPDWSAPPPWVAGGPAEGGSTAPLAPNGPGTSAWNRPPEPATPPGVTRPPLPEDIAPPDFLRTPDADPAAAGNGFDGGFEDESDLPGEDSVAARMRTMGAPGPAGSSGGATYAGAAYSSGGAIDPRMVEDPYDPSATAKPVAGTTRNVPPAAGAVAAAGIAAGAASDFDDDYSAPRPPASAPPPSSGGLARALGWDRRPKAGSGRARPEAQPSWERPRRYEAYPTLKTRVGFGAPSRLLLYAAALLVAAVVLFVVPPLLLRSGGAGNAGASGSSDPSALASGGSARPSAGRSAAPTAKQVTYTIKQGDTLSTIARRFHVSVEDILAANKQIKNPNKITVGDVIVIPTPAPTTITNGEPSPT